MTENRYVFDNAVTAETGIRFSGLEATYDHATIGYLTGVGVTEGWVCWELGAGGGSIANWLASQVGPAGSVLATDIDPRFIPPPELSQLEVVRHDVTADAIPESRYDLVHARLVLSHLPRRSDVMVRLERALGPGGWLVIEDFSGAFERGTEPVGPADARFRKVHRALGDFLARSNDDRSDFAASLPHQLVSLGLADVGGEARVVFARGGSPGARVMEAGLRQVGDRMIAAGLVDRPALDEAIAYLDTPSSVVSMPTMVSAWGRRAG
ncbi:MAG TPA: methyltransferase [Streptosporangiaceae bacterium]|nr:methyltransferase [Streptosporangiaceae bacterium]